MCKRTCTCHADTEMSSILKSEADDKTYRIIHLENGLKALLVSHVKWDEDGAMSQEKDEEGLETANIEEEIEEGDEMLDDQEEEERTVQTMGIAALCIGIGSFSDPPDIPGLATLLEYMIVEGSEKYPDDTGVQDVFKTFGDFNSYIHYERTVFQFSAERESFQEFLMRFAQFFISPLLKEDSIDKVLQQLDSDFQNTWTCDDNRKDQLLSTMCVKDHPLGKFEWGNTETIKIRPEEKGINVHQRLREFRERNYSAQYMTLVVLSEEPLDVLQRWVTESFSDIPNNNLPKEKFEEYGPPFDPEKFNKLYKVVPVKDCEQIHLTWSLQPLLKHYKSSPVKYLRHLMGHEGQGSIKALLTRRSLARKVEISCPDSDSEQDPMHTLFSVVVTLTETGFEHIEDVVAVIFQYIKMMQQIGPQKRIFKEMQTIANNDFRFQEKAVTLEWISAVAENMQLYSDEHILAGHLLRFEYNPQLYAEIANCLTMDNANIMLYSKRFVEECTSEEYWYKTKYTVEEIPAEWRQRVADLELNPDLHLPKPNKFIATNFDLKAADIEYTDFPEAIVDDAVSRIFYKKDNFFKVPRGYICLQLVTPIVGASDTNQVLLDLMTLTLEHNVSEVGFDANVAGLKYTFKTDCLGLQMEVNGFNHKLLDLVKMLIDYLADFSFRKDQFESLKQGLMSSYYNRTITKTHLMDDIIHALLEEKTHFPLDKATILQDIEENQVKSFASNFRRQLYIKGLVEGNITSKEAIDLKDYVRNRLACKPIDCLSFNSAIQVNNGLGIFRVKGLGPQDKSIIVSNYYQLFPGTLKVYCELTAIVALMEDLCSEALKTQEQLVDGIGIKVENTFGVLGLSVIVMTQATKCSAAHVNRRIDDFLRSFSDILSNISEETFREKIELEKRYRLCSQLLLEEEVDFHWTEITGDSFLFALPAIEAINLELTTFDYIKNFWQKHFANDENWRKISFQVIGNSEAELFNKLDPSNNEVDREKGRDLEGGIKSPKMSLEVVPLEEVYTGYIIDDINAFKRHRKKYPFTKLKR